MAHKKPLQDKGAFIEATKPLQFLRCEPGKLPDPSVCNGCAIVINDRASPDSRLRLALSNGASWDRFVLEPDRSSAVQLSEIAPVAPVQIQHPSPQVIQLQPAPIPQADIDTQHKLQRVADKLQKLEDNPNASDSIAELSQLLAEFAVDHANQAHRLDELEARTANLEGFVHESSKELKALDFA